jgi:CBS-domain-containing membrane protein
MNSAIERLLSLRVSDVMNRGVVQVSQHDSLSQAAHTLAEKSISGAPVVDEQGRCVGVLSATDFVKRHAGRNPQRSASRLCGDEQQLSSPGPQGALNLAASGDELVCHHMSSAVQSVRAEQTLITAARMMCAEHVHRLPVLDDHGRVAGMLTSLDVVAALVHAVEE